MSRDYFPKIVINFIFKSFIIQPTINQCSAADTDGYLAMAGDGTLMDFSCNVLTIFLAKLQDCFDIKTPNKVTVQSNGGGCQVSSVFAKSNI